MNKRKLRRRDTGSPGELSRRRAALREALERLAAARHNLAKKLRQAKQAKSRTTHRLREQLTKCHAAERDARRALCALDARIQDT